VALIESQSTAISASRASDAIRKASVNSIKVDYLKAGERGKVEAFSILAPSSTSFSNFGEARAFLGK
jgi:hypothetical protein